MNRENLPAIKRTTILDRIKNAFRKMFSNNQTEQLFTNSTLPNNEKINSIKMMEIVQSETRLRNAIINNKKLMTPKLQGITQRDAENILQWVVSNAREALFTCDKEEDDLYQSLQGLCGFGQALTAIPLINMGLKPNINQIAETLDHASGNHGFITVSMPVTENENIAQVPYLVDTTFRQFFQTHGTSYNGKDVRDNELGRVSPNEGYFLRKMENGTKFSDELLRNGYIQLTPQNAKLYCDAFFNASRELKSYNRAPTKKELETGISGEEYIRRLFDPRRQSEIDFQETELQMLRYNVKTPLQQTQEAQQEVIPREDTTRTISKEELTR